MRILWVGTKPPWPPIDGGRLVAATTLQALAEAGHDLTLVAPFDPSRDDAARAADGLREWCEPVLVESRPRPLAGTALASVARRQPLSVVRHTLDAVRERVAQLLGARAFDVVHAEQPQALAQCRDAFDRGLPVVLRAQNVETDLWAASAVGRPILGVLARLEAARMARFEGEAVRRTAATVALTSRDADRLRALSGAPEKVRHVAAPFPSVLPAADSPLPGAPAVVLVGSGGWLPNQQGAAWFVRAVWPQVSRALPAASLHVFGEAGAAGAARVVPHPALAESRQAFAPGAVMVVPLTFGSGVRMKILEAWARGVPVVATPAAAEGLDAEAGRELLLARGPEDFVAALRLLTLDSRLAPGLVARGRELLAARHAPARIASELTGLYEACQNRVTPTP
jgi:hypothetical protein